MTDQADIASAFRTQARAQRDSLITASLLRGAAADIDAGGATAGLLASVLDRASRSGRLLLTDALPARFAAAMHYVALSGGTELSTVYPSSGGGGNLHEVWPVARDVIAASGLQIADRLLRPSRRSDPARAAMLLIGLAAIGAADPRPVRIFDVGAGAGLLLTAAAYRQDFFGEIIGPPDSPVDLGHPWQSAPSIDHASIPTVIEQLGADIAPVDLRSHSDVLDVMCWVAPDVSSDYDRIDGALELVASHGVSVIRAPSSVWLPRCISWPRTDAASVMWHSDTVLEMSVPERTELATEILAAASRATDAAPLRVLSFEPAGADQLLYVDPVGAAVRRGDAAIDPTRFELRLLSWPEGTVQLLATAEPSGTGAQWVGARV